MPPVSSSARFQQVSPSPSGWARAPTPPPPSPLPLTAPDLRLESVSAVPLCPPSVRVSWEPVPPALLNGPQEEAVFLIQWESGEGMEYTESVPYSPSTTVSVYQLSLSPLSLTHSPTQGGLVEGLMLETTYSLSVSVVNGNGSSTPSQSVEVTTPPLGG